MAAPKEFVQKGYELPSLTIGPIDRLNLIRMALFLHDANPAHLDRVYAQESGLKDVIQQGPLNVAYLIQMLMEWAGPEARLIDVSMRFRANAHPGETLESRGKVLDRYQDGPHDCVQVEVTQSSSSGAVTLMGKALLQWER